jgi:peptidoglycan/xylan/chitin deacetylase (PgdA/CDA1 family)
MYYLDEEPKRSPVRKFLIFVLLLAGAYFGLQKWSPATLEKAMFWKKPAKAVAGPVPDIRIEPAPKPVAGAPAGSPVVAATPAAGNTAPATVDKAAQVAVLLYHRVEAKASPALRIAPAVFEEHMEKLKTAGITVISMQDFLAWRRGEKSIPAKSAMITIDDGFVSAYDVARPILKKYGYPWTCFVYTNFISRGSGLTWEQLAELRDEGVEIGCHSASHLNLRDQQGKPVEVYDEWLKQEVAGAKQLIEQRLGIRCATYAYPFGSYSARVQEAVKQAGYEAAFTLGSARTTFFTPADRIPRYSWLDERPELFNPVFSWSGRVAGAEAPAVAPNSPGTAPLPPVAAPEMLTQPLDGEVIREPQPVLQANIAALGTFDPNSVSLRLSGAGLLPISWTDASKTSLSAKLPKPLTPGEYTWTIGATVNGKRVEAQFKFRFDPTGGYDDALSPAK